MRLQQGRSPLGLLLLTSLAATSVLASSPDSVALNAVTGPRLGTKDAPVDGKDGRPHEGPFVEHTASSASGDANKDLPPLEGRPEDPTVVDGVKIPQTNDGVMNDPDRSQAKEGTTGTSGGVSEKDQARKEKEGATGEKAENKPESPKEAPPLPQSEQDKMLSSEKGRPEGRPSDDASGPERFSNLPGKTGEMALPVPESANKHHLDIPSRGKSSSSYPAADPDSMIRPFHTFLISYGMIVVNEIGDKTFVIAVLMAMKHDRMVVFWAASSALITMTVLSSVLGHAVPMLVSKRVTCLVGAALFLYFGARLLREAMAMSPDEGMGAEMAEVEVELEERENLARRAWQKQPDSTPDALEMGLHRAPRRTSSAQSRFHELLSPEASPERRPRRGAVRAVVDGAENLFSLLLSPAWVQTFVMTFLGEWGDRSQLATIAMAAGQDYWWVTLGAVVGHASCTSIAVLGGRAVAGKVSLKHVTTAGAVAFFFFGVLYFIDGLWWS